MKVSNLELCNNKCKDKDYFIFVSNNHASTIIINFISMTCKCVRAEYEYLIGDIDTTQFINDIISSYECGKEGKLKGAIFDLFYLKPLKTQYKLCIYWKKFCENEKIPHQFINSSTLVISSILRGSVSEFNEKSLFTLVHISKAEILIFDLEINILDFLVKKQTTLNLDCSDKLFKDTVMKSKKSSEIILSVDNQTNTRQFSTLLKSLKLQVLNENYSSYISQSLEEMISDINGSFPNIFKVFPYFEGDIFVIKKQKNDKCFGSFEIKCLKNAKLPYSETALAYVSTEEIVEVSFWNGENFEMIQSSDVSNYKGSHIELTLSIDVNGFFNLIIEKTQNLNFSLFCKRQRDIEIYLDHENDEISISIPEIGYNFKIPTFIYFFGSIFVGEVAKELALQHPSFVVYDLFTLAKMSTSNKIKINPKWGFKVEKDLNGNLQIIFETWRGTRKTTPEFLLAILINYLFKLAKDKIGFHPKVVDIHFDDNFRFLEKPVIAALKILDNEYTIKSDRSERMVKVDKLFFKVEIKMAKGCEEAFKKRFGKSFR